MSIGIMDKVFQRYPNGGGEMLLALALADHADDDGTSIYPSVKKLAAIKRGIAPPDLRNWGRVFTQAARDGHIRRSEVLFPRAMGNGSLAPGWIAA